MLVEDVGGRYECSVREGIILIINVNKRSQFSHITMCLHVQKLMQYKVSNL